MTLGILIDCMHAHTATLSGLLAVFF